MQFRNDYMCRAQTLSRTCGYTGKCLTFWLTKGSLVHPILRHFQFLLALLIDCRSTTRLVLGRPANRLGSLVTDGRFGWAVRWSKNRTLGLSAFGP